MQIWQQPAKSITPHKTIINSEFSVTKPIACCLAMAMENVCEVSTSAMYDFRDWTLSHCQQQDGLVWIQSAAEEHEGGRVKQRITGIITYSLQIHLFFNINPKSLKTKHDVKNKYWTIGTQRCIWLLLSKINSCQPSWAIFSCFTFLFLLINYISFIVRWYLLNSLRPSLPRSLWCYFRLWVCLERELEEKRRRLILHWQQTSQKYLYNFDLLTGLSRFHFHITALAQ